MRMRGKKPIISYKDTWNLDQSVFIPVIVEALKKYRSIESDFKGTPATFLKRTKRPGCAFNDNTPEFKERCLDNEPDDLGYIDHERWNKTIDFIIESLEAKEPEYEGEIDMTFDEADPETGLSKVNLKVSDEELWDKYKKETERWERNRRRAVELFAVYFFDFWW